MATTTTAAAAIDIGELEQELSRTRAMFEQWSAKIHARATGCKASHTSKLLAHKDEMAALEERYQRAEKQAAQVRQQMAQDREHEQALQATADSLVGEQHALQKRLQQLRLHFGSDDEAVQQLRVEVDGSRADLDLHLSSLDQVHNTYQDALGLRLQSQDGELYLEFTQISAAQPDKPYGFAVKVLDESHYEVTRCEPQLPKRGVLEQQLAAGKLGFAAFVRGMRQQFKALAAAEEEAGGAEQGAAEGKQAAA